MLILGSTVKQNTPDENLRIYAIFWFVIDFDDV